jgi:hypothetical protein
MYIRKNESIHRILYGMTLKDKESDDLEEMKGFGRRDQDLCC